MDGPPKVTRWEGESPPGEEALNGLMAAEGLEPHWWGNGPGDLYAAHSHDYHKVLYCARGSISFVLRASGEHVKLNPGDRLDLPPGTEHAAIVGSRGVACVEGWRRD